MKEKAKMEDIEDQIVNLMEASGCTKEAGIHICSMLALKTFVLFFPKETLPGFIQKLKSIAEDLYSKKDNFLKHRLENDD